MKSRLALAVLMAGALLPTGCSTYESSRLIHASKGAPAWGDFDVQYQYPARLSGHMGILEFYFNSPKNGPNRVSYDFTYC